MLNGIKSKNILVLILRLIKCRLKLKIIKYNKSIKDKINIKIKDYEDFNLLKELNKKYNLDIQDIETQILDISEKQTGDEIFDYLNQIGFNDLIEINLSKNEITKLELLESPKFEKLKILRLNNNELSDINFLEKINFKELKEIYLDYNHISNIDILERVKFLKLEKLSLKQNI